MRTSNRRGFTLLELLVVIALLAILSALSVGAYFKIRSAQEGVATDQLLTKINTALDRQWSAARDQADKEFRENNLPGDPYNTTTLLPFSNTTDGLITFCGGDRDRARSLWIYLRLKNEFPQTFREATSSTQIILSGNVIASLPRRKTFTANKVIFPTPPGTIAAAPTSNEVAAAQASALLYIIVTEKAGRGEAFGDEALGGGQNMVRVGATSYDVKAFADSWFTPISFVRFATNAEIAGPPYAKAAGNLDPIDPLGKLKTPWGANRTAAYSWLFFNNGTQAPAAPDNNASNAYTQAFNTNWLPTAVSAGPDKIFDAPNWMAPNATTGLIAVAYNTDDLLGYRVKREGSKGE